MVKKKRKHSLMFQSKQLAKYWFGHQQIAPKKERSELDADSVVYDTITKIYRNGIKGHLKKVYGGWEGN